MRSHLILCDDVVENGACLARKSLFTQVLRTSKLNRWETQSQAFHYFAVRIRTDEPNRYVGQGGILITRPGSDHLVSRWRKVDGGIIYRSCNYFAHSPKNEMPKGNDAEEMICIYTFFFVQPYPIDPYFVNYEEQFFVCVAKKRIARLKPRERVLLDKRDLH